MTNKLFISAAALALVACARTEPIPDDALDNVEPPAPVALDEDDAATAPQLTPGMRWEIDEAANAALYGADRASPALSIRCDEDERALVLTRYFPTVPSGAGTMTLTGGGAIASVPVSAEQNEGRPGGRLTATLDMGDLANSVGTVFRSGEVINVSVTGAEPVVLMGGSEVSMILDACLGTADNSVTEEVYDAETAADEA
ncbi:hypothetical protein [Sphingomicrobium clamense]|uniref:Lipoprotein n=1 Tax=Sphingomicrobium clamense TaxID=2851013 RepID=A0ABS6V422_9SPHN|nr:hypothetical protein [Sphingomicrobium sp. B8]MBW0144251.1 hypothetical protein [Sphingomicrobium sp. B8]